ncbi:GNAT family N-acetyltransferase [Chitinimonas sp.]|uniref:GNAT family N-acetyltransferase n=1 Tax=Chitinimonas sp. TaxID=1934313 RepID=UPI0035B30C69
MIDIRQSLAYHSNLIFHHADGEVADCGDYLRIRTPSNPRFWWGNFLLFGQPPAAGDLPRWDELFQAEIAAQQPLSQHRAFGWLGARGDTAALEAAGYEVIEALQLVCDQPVLPDNAHAGVDIRPLADEAEWLAATELQILARDAVHSEASFRPFKEAQMLRYRLLSEAGGGFGYGAWLDGALVANLGVFANDELARYQNVATHPDYRRRGIAARIVYEAGCHMLATFGPRRLVIVADKIGPQTLYRSVGFQPAGFAYGADKAPPAQ